MSRITESKIVELAKRNEAVIVRGKLDENQAIKHFASLLTEDAYLKKGAKVYIRGSMGACNVEGTFEEESNGWARVKREDGSDYWVHYFRCHPTDK
jgi:hypothetical protein